MPEDRELLDRLGYALATPREPPDDRVRRLRDEVAARAASAGRPGRRGPIMVAVAVAVTVVLVFLERKRRRARPVEVVEVRVAPAARRRSTRR